MQRTDRACPHWSQMGVSFGHALAPRADASSSATPMCSHCHPGARRMRMHGCAYRTVQVCTAAARTLHIQTAAWISPNRNFQHACSSESPAHSMCAVAAERDACVLTTRLGSATNFEQHPADELTLEPNVCDVRPCSPSSRKLIPSATAVRTKRQLGAWRMHGRSEHCGHATPQVCEIYLQCAWSYHPATKTPRASQSCWRTGATFGPPPTAAPARSRRSAVLCVRGCLHVPHLRTS